MKHLFVSYEIAKLLKEKGFDENCLYYYYVDNELSSMNEDGKPLWMNHNNSIFSTCYSAPLKQQVIDWFRDKHKTQLFLDYTYNDGFHYGYKWVKSNGEFGTKWGWETPEEAFDNVIKEFLKLI